MFFSKIEFFDYTGSGQSQIVEEIMDERSVLRQTPAIKSLTTCP